MLTSKASIAAKKKIVEMKKAAVIAREERSRLKLINKAKKEETKKAKEMKKAVDLKKKSEKKVAKAAKKPDVLLKTQRGKENRETNASKNSKKMKLRSSNNN